MQTVSKIIKDLMIEQPYYGLYALGLNKKFVKNQGTCAVGLDGINFYLAIDPEYWKESNHDKRMFLIMHELGHLLFFHIQDFKKFHTLCSDHSLLNIAMDMSVNSWIPDLYNKAASDSTANIIFQEMPFIPKGKGVKFYIEVLQDIKQQRESSNDSSSDQSSDSSSDQSSDSSDEDDQRKYIMNRYKKLPNDKKEEIQRLLITSEDLHKIWKKLLEELDKDNKNELTRAQTEYLMKEVAKDIMQNQGSVPAGIREILDRIMKPKPPVFNWKSFFRRNLGIAIDVYQKKTRRKESKRFEESNGLKLKKKHKILVALDTSGSVAHKEFVDFFNEIHHIYKTGADIHILECDAEITNEYDYKGIPPTQITGRGGTSFMPCVEYYNKHRNLYQTCVYFTDGYGDQEACTPIGQMLWVITSDGYQSGEYPGIKICIPKENENEYNRD